ncbi:MAG: signal peptidase I [Nanoarchaeota archaeon]|nr:signal peptidase I [Nanoarchaeota archaeon]|tara:strand:- start:76 stop:705 length:630 start_codon:yes stop_codon:yes gene_type:complete
MNWKKIWFFIWKDDSLLSWLVNVVLAIIIVKFIIFPALGFALNTGFPVVAVVSCSMEHGITNCGNDNREEVLCGDNNLEEEITNFDDYWEICGAWYEDNAISKESFIGFSFSNGFNKGDIMVLYGVKMKDVNVGDVIVFDSGLNSAPIIHRVVGVDENGVTTKGDHNIRSESFEKDIKEDEIFGKAVFRVPYLGWVKVVFSDLVGGVLR